MNKQNIPDLHMQSLVAGLASCGNTDDPAASVDQNIRCRSQHGTSPMPNYLESRPWNVSTIDPHIEGYRTHGSPASATTLFLLKMGDITFEDNSMIEMIYVSRAATHAPDNGF